MPITGPDAEFRRFIAKIKRFARGDATRSLPKELGEASMKLVEESFRTKAGPNGRPWRQTPGAGDLHDSGRLQAGMRLGMRAGGFAIVNIARSRGGSLYAGTHQYGRTIRAKGPAMKYRGGDGRWHAAVKVRIPARPILPGKRTLPLRWNNEFTRVTARFFAKELKP